ncbi:hypothetical protein Agub_g6063 [Astrephomene gubernaculifera]|uniref:Amine oxidase n=1 Tax=Astrephomene gubernaculifera TaxID=47775 RepID=A0AAD3HLH6_9CHLO|nr:hypothetical protein Agub_g6063 [Astrephomene gubernaculifera]
MATLAQRVPAADSHPLDQLSPNEIRRAVEACKLYAVANGVSHLRFNTVMLREPPKRALLAYERGSGPRPERLAECILILPYTSRAVEAMVRLGAPGAAAGAATPPPAPAPVAAEVVSWKELEGVQPLTTPDDNFEAEAVVRADPRVAQLLAERYGVTDVANQLICDTWACHHAPQEFNHRRLMQGFLYLKLSGPHDNEYAHPLDLVPLVDLNERKVIHIDMYSRPPPVPTTPANYHPTLADRPPRTDLRPLHVVQPQGPSFSLRGGCLHWQRWRLRVGFTGREGLVLHGVGYEEGGRVRPVLHRGSLVEMAVPYGDPNVPYIRKCAFDVGDYGLGLCANSLALGCDCLGHIAYLDAVVNNARGDPVLIPKAICIHEEDAGICWKHFDCRSGESQVRRSRRLVVSSVSTFMNYEYASYWHLYTDGSIAFELKLTGILSTSIAPAGESDPPFGVRVSPGVNATVHQHFFCMRLDLAIDDEEGGRNLIVSEVESVPLPPGPPANPAGNAFRMVARDLTSTGAAQRCHNFPTARFWSIRNPGRLNPVSGRPLAYRLMPAASPFMQAHPSSLVARRALFASRQLWVTPHCDSQRYPAGDHVVQSERCRGLAEWTQQDTPLRGADPVLWYSFGVTHAPRVEDFPVMPVEVCGFSLKPDGFFAANPAIDLPPTRDTASREESAQGAEHQQQQQGVAGGGSCCGETATTPAAAPATPAAACCGPLAKL